MSRILCIADGMTDESFNADCYKNISKMKYIGKKQNTPENMDIDTVNCVLHILGIKNINKNIRGYIEALGCAIPLEDDDLIFRISWYGVDENNICQKPIPAPETITGEYFSCYNIKGNKSIIVLKKQGFMLDKINTTPPYDVSGKNADLFKPYGLDILEKYFADNLKNAKCPIIWGQSKKINLEKFKGKAAVVCGIDKVKGIAKALKMDIFEVEGATGDTDTDLEHKVKTALKCAQEYPFVLLHINGADEASHRLNQKEKTDFINKIDSIVLEELLCSHNDIIFTSDHGTDCKTGAHIGRYQPYFVRFSEEINYEKI